ncbi:Protein of unknown function [Hydrocarboniphaga daqingensis]|uniref:DUF1329 domain-containing protein n=1 Tax=Hydrocarboniphaga daqingensis TaxID=490188 RepID=A0A1M5R3H4_9GAMM|nr:DUF1329 domain-containing protein [Hydrocarboniphaga daqingensis]SHH20656.1 Protein of unknown function [Hydrocarboniphaga daqingensis]
MKNMKRLSMCSAMLLALVAQGAMAKVGADEAAKLGGALTPIGAEKAGNKDGSIPAWTPAPQKGKLSGEFASDAAIEADKPIDTITAASIAKYGDQLSEGSKYLLKTFPNYKMIVYPSHRTVSWPDFIYKSTAANATTCELKGTDDPDNCVQGFPFPIPKSGAEVIWNHRLKWRGDTVRRNNDQLNVDASGHGQTAQLVEDISFLYANSVNPVPLKEGKGLFLYYLSKIMSPARTAGTMILVNESAGVGASGRAAWLYAPALKRIRRAPAVCCDNPYEGSDGQQFYDQVDMYNGVLERYTWKLVGKKEMIIPYNNFKMSRAKYAEIVNPNFPNPNVARYEKHRVWVVEANLVPGERHTYAKRTLYVDEDSWDIVMIDCYDAKGALFNFQEGFLTPQPNVQTVFTVPEVIHHFDSGRYFMTALQAEGKPNDYSVKYPDGFFTDSAVQQRASK